MKSCKSYTTNSLINGRGGFTIYRTVYTPESSHDVFLEAISKTLYASLGLDRNEDEH